MLLWENIEDFSAIKMWLKENEKEKLDSGISINYVAFLCFSVAVAAALTTFRRSFSNKQTETVEFLYWKYKSEIIFFIFQTQTDRS